MGSRSSMSFKTSFRMNSTVSTSRIRLERLMATVARFLAVKLSSRWQTTSARREARSTSSGVEF